MKVAFITRKSLFTAPGGDTIQLLKTKEYLEKLGVEIDIIEDFTSINIDSYDIIHAFNIIDPQDIFVPIQKFKEHNKKVLLSTIYVTYGEFEKNARSGISKYIFKFLDQFTIQYLKRLVKTIKNSEFYEGNLIVLKKGYFNTIKKMINNVDIFLPNSVGEMNALMNDFKLKDLNYKVVPNAVDAKVFDYEKTEINEKYKDYVLCVARIEGLKNQLNVVKAMKGLPFKLLIIGKSSPNQYSFYQKVKEEAGDNIEFLEHIPHDELPPYYKAARVNILASWMETTGLVSLEAAIMKCNLVITRKGHTEEYFRDYAYYCEPDDVESIRKAILDAYNNPFNESFRDYIIDNYTWEKTSLVTYEAYKDALGLN